MVLTMKCAHVAVAALMLWSNAIAAQRSPNTGPPQARPLLFGFALECTDCEPGMGARGRAGGGGQPATRPWTYRTYPDVIAVAPGSAAERAGIRPGDKLHDIDGLSLLSNEGAQRFSSATSGEKVTLGFERAGKPVSFALVLGAPLFASTSGERINVGYMALNGTLHGDMKMDFWTDEPIHMIPDSTTQTITFQIGTGTIIRLKFTKDTNDAANRPGVKKDGAQWF